MINTIVYKVRNFPRVSETFVVSNIINAIIKGYQVRIIANNKLQSNKSSQIGLLNQYRLESKTFSFHQPKKKISRFVLAFFYIINPILCYYFVKYCIAKKHFSLGYLFNLKFHKSFRKAKIFHIHFAIAADDIPILKKIGFIKSKILVTFHGFDAYYLNDLELEQLKSKYTLLFNMVKKVTINNLYLKERLLALGCPVDKLKIIPVGIDVDFFKPENYPKKIDKIDKFNFISVGRLIEIKGHEYGIKAVKLLVDKGYNVSYTIIGEGVLYDKLNALIFELGLENNVKLFGKASQSKIKIFLENSHFFLMTSIKDQSGREEAQGIVTAEAQAMGLPVLGFNSGGVSSTVSNKTAMLVNEKEIDKLYEKIVELIKNKKKYSCMSQDARKWVVSNFNISTMVDAYYEDLI